MASISQITRALKIFGRYKTWADNEDDIDLEGNCDPTGYLQVTLPVQPTQEDREALEALGWSSTYTERKPYVPGGQNHGEYDGFIWTLGCEASW
jgi:hypothetical protein